MIKHIQWWKTVCITNQYSKFQLINFIFQNKYCEDVKVVYYSKWTIIYNHKNKFSMWYLKAKSSGILQIMTRFLNQSTCFPVNWIYATLFCVVYCFLLYNIIAGTNTSGVDQTPWSCQRHWERKGWIPMRGLRHSASSLHLGRPIRSKCQRKRRVSKSI